MKLAQFLFVASPLIETKQIGKRPWEKNEGVKGEGKCQLTCISRKLLTDTLSFTHAHSQKHPSISEGVRIFQYITEKLVPGGPYISEKLVPGGPNLM